MNKTTKKEEELIRDLPESRISLMRYDEAGVEELDLQNLEHIPERAGKIHWINIVGPTTEMLADLTARFELHPLTREYHDVAGQRPALYEFDNHLLVTARAISLEQGELRSELIGLVLGEGFVITFQQCAEDDFDSVRNRLRSKIGYIRMRGADHLFYRLLDAITEQYFLVSEHLEDRADALMDSLESGNADDAPHRIRELREVATEFRRAVSPLRDVLASLLKSEIKLITKNVMILLRDVHQQSIQLVELGQGILEQVKEIQDRHHLLISERMNDTVKVLTVVTSFFIPLSFLSGVYGMNFVHMPELDWKYSYLIFWIIAIGISVAMYRGFKKRKWF